MGLISRTGIIPLALSQDTAGPMARTVTDAVITLGVLTGVDSTDPISVKSEGKALSDYTKHLKKDGLNGARIGIDYSYFFNTEDEILEIRQYSSELGIDKVMKENHLDALLFANNFGAELPAKAGYPSITVPAGYTGSGMPVGVTFSGRAFSEPRLIELAYSYEQHSKKRIPPVFK